MNREELKNLSLPQRVKFLNSLRDIVARKMPKNKAGCAMVSDFDLIVASDDEMIEAKHLTFGQLP